MIVAKQTVRSTCPIFQPYRCPSHLLITITKTTKLLLASGIPSVEDEVTEVGVEGKGMDFDTKSS
jgi:hypothetical protein